MLYPKSVTIILAPTYRMLHDSTMRTMFAIIPDVCYTYHKSEERCEFPNGSEFLFRSADSPDRLRGIEAAFLHVDEGAMVSKAAWDIAIGRLRQQGYPHRAIVTTTPKGFNWIYDAFIQNESPDYYYVLSSSLENKHLPPDYIDSLLTAYTGQFREQEVNGGFVRFDGLVYPEFCEAVHITHTLPELDRYAAGIDWGYTDPFVIMIAGMDSDGRLYLVDEYQKRKMQNEEIISVVSRMYEQYHFSMAYCDHEPGSIAMLRKAGIPATEAAKDVIPGIRAVASRLAVQGDGKPRLFVHPRCVNYLSDVRQYSYPEGRADRENEKPAHPFSHSQDAVRYMIYSIDQGVSEFAAVDGFGDYEFW